MVDVDNNCLQVPQSVGIVRRSAASWRSSTLIGCTLVITFSTKNKWTLDKSLQKRLTAFEHWCYRRMLKISWMDKVKNTEVLSRMAEVEPQFYRNIARQKMACAWHIFRGSSGINALLILEGKISGVKGRGRPRRAWTDDLKAVSYTHLTLPTKRIV